MDDDFLTQLLARYQSPYTAMSESANERLGLIPAERESLLTQRRDTYKNSPEEYGNMIGSFLLPALAGGISKDWQTGLGWGSAVSGSVMQGLAAQEAEDRKLLDQKIGLLDDEQKYLRDFTNDNQRAAAAAGNQLALNYFGGGIVGSDPYKQERADQLAAQKELFGMRAAGQDKAEGIFNPEVILPKLGFEGALTQDRPITASELQAINSAAGAVTSRESLQSRVNKDAGKFLSAGIPGRVSIPGMQPAEKLDKIREMYSYESAALGSLDELERLMQERKAKGLEPIDFGERAQLFEMLAKSVVPWARAYGGTGASLTGEGRAGEVSQLTAFTPLGAASLVGDGPEYMASVLKGQDPIQYVKDLKRMIQQNTANRGVMYGVYDPENRDYIAPREAQRIEQLAKAYGLENPWGNYVDVLLQQRAQNPVLQQQAELSGETLPTAAQNPASVESLVAPPPTPTPASIPFEEAARQLANQMKKAGSSKKEYDQKFLELKRQYGR